MNNKNMLWYRQPANCWQQALPLGNGRIGAMIYGGAAQEVIDLSECTFVSGEAAMSNSQDGAPEAYRTTREALLGGDYKGADNAAQGYIGRKLNYGTNLPVGKLILDFGISADATDYQRSLDIETALSQVTFTTHGTIHTRKALCSNPHQIIAMQLKNIGKDKLDFTLRFDTSNPYEIAFDGDLLAKVLAHESIHSDGCTGVKLHLRARVLTKGGTVNGADSRLTVVGADEAFLIIAMNTDFANADAEVLCRQQVNAAAHLSFEALLDTHRKDFYKLFAAVELDLGNGNDNQPTDERVTAVRGGAVDDSLTALMFQYGRYLLICSSRENSPLPAHLQGGWNDGIACCIGWTCDMHLDINTQMNYWPALTTGLAQCADPLYRWMADVLIPSGRRTATEIYGLPGWVAHTVSNAWGYTAPGWHVFWGIHVTGGIWILTHLWEHYQFTGDLAFLKKALPLIRESVLFFTHYLIEDPKSGYLLPVPSYSPENAFVQDGKPYVLSEGATCDVVLIRELFKIYTVACDLLGCTDSLVNEASSSIERLPPFQIGRHGQLQEWLKDFDESIPNHRHTSHLLALFPFAQITPDSTPALCDAAHITIHRRLHNNAQWQDTGWARSMLLLYAARLHDTESAHEHVLAFQRYLTNDNLFVFHPPLAGAQTNVYELDGNTGMTAGIVEMLLQSQDGTLHLLPAMPFQWSSGFVKGLKARGGYSVDIFWQDSILKKAVITSVNGKSCAVRYRNATAELQFLGTSSVEVEWIKSDAVFEVCGK